MGQIALPSNIYENGHRLIFTLVYMKWLLIFFCLSNNCVHAQNSNMPHGTLLGAVILNDGIVFCADSRACWTIKIDSSEAPVAYAYLDSVQKIFSIGYFRIAIAGNAAINNILWDEVIRKYNKKTKPDSSLLTTFTRFLEYLQNENIPDSLISENIFVLVGYENGVPFILSREKGKSKPIIIKHGRIFSESIAEDFYKRIIPKPTISDGITKSIIDVFVHVSNNIQSIGGPTYIILINPDNSMTELNEVKFRKKYKKESDFLRAVLKHQENITYVYPWSEELLMKTLKSK